MSCEHDCDRPPIFPKNINNRPGLARYKYRIGTYTSMREHMLGQLVKRPGLTGWTHLRSDEPGIALLEGAATIGDILTFYQQFYGNETKLGTAEWSQSVRDLIRLTGYRPGPGLGGAALFALQVDGLLPVVVPAGFPFEAQLETQDAPSKFESTEAVEAYPAFNSFHLYRPRLGPQPIKKGAKSLDIARFGTARDLATRSEPDLKEGDRVIILSGLLDPQEILVVASVEVHLDRVTIHFDGALRQNHPAEVRAFKIGRTFRHFGADSAREFTTFHESPPSVSVHKTKFKRRTLDDNEGSADFYSRLGRRRMPLDQEVDDLAVGARVICVGHISGPIAADFVLVRRINKIIARDVTWANTTAPVTTLLLNAPLRIKIKASPSALTGTIVAGLNIITPPALASNLGNTNAILFDASGVLNALDLASPSVPDPQRQDIRRLRIYETLGPRMLLHAPPKQRSGRISDGRVTYFGTRAEAEALAGRRLQFKGKTETPQEITVAGAQPELEAKPKGPAGDHRMWPLALSSLPEAGPEGFSENNPAVTIYGNLVDATEGESQPETVLGSGDARTILQTFALPKAPLTFLPDAARTPPYRAELEIRVAGRLWLPVNTFFDQPDDAKIYVIRQDEEGNDFVQFGNGTNGATLPSGQNNVVATYRTGSGAWGELSFEAEAKAKGKIKSVTGVLMPGPATGGAAPEMMDTARLAAPERMQGLGRLVGLTNYEAEALALPGVLKSGVTFGATGTSPVIDITVLTEDESDAAVSAVEAALRHADRCRGPARYSINVISGKRRYVAIELWAGYDPAFRSADIDTAIRHTLGALPLLPDGALPEEGLFSLDRRQFGQDVHISQIIATVQQIEGVVWVKPIVFRRLAATREDPADIPLPRTPRLLARLGARPREVLALSAHHLTVQSISVTTDEECPQ